MDHATVRFMPAGAVTQLLNSLDSNAFASLAAEMGVETLAPPDGAEAQGDASEAPEEGMPEEGDEEPASSDRPTAEPTAEGMAAYAEQALADAQAHRDEIEVGLKAAEESGDKGAKKKIAKILKEADSFLKDAEKACDAAKKAASKEDMGKAAEGAADAKEACEEIEKLLAEAKGQPVAEGDAAPDSNAPAGAPAAPAKTQPVGSPWGQWAAAG